MNSEPHDKASIVRFLHENRYEAHQVLFKNRHPQLSSPAHRQTIDEWHDDHLKRIFLAFRGFGKSTISEEAFIIRALFQEFHNGLILGENETRAVERLASVKHELEYNEFITAIFGLQVGALWQATKIILPNGVCIQAVGSGQSLRGIKHLQYRPDCVLVDDVEGDKDASTPEQRVKTRSWFTSVVLPALSPGTLVRMTATPLDEESLPLMLSRAGTWTTSTIPIKHLDTSSGSWMPTWQERYPMPFIDALESEYGSIGSLAEFSREYMCVATTESERTFKESYFRTTDRLRAWHSVYVMYDPARTTNQQTSAMTGKVVFSWFGSKLVVWESGGYFWMPDELVEDVFKAAALYHPVVIGVEQDGLHEFIMQPLRRKMALEGLSLPLEPFKAPRGKLDFIKGLQPFFKAQDVEFFGDGHDELKKQLLNFPRGRIDVPNALAYALTMRPGQPVYGEFHERHIAHDLVQKGAEPLWCVLNCNQAQVSTLVLQFIGGCCRVLWDQIMDGAPGEAIPKSLKEAKLQFGRAPRGLASPRHFKPYDTLGLRPAAKSHGFTLFQGGDPPKGEDELRTLLRSPHGFQCSPEASWTLRALSGGYAVGMDGKQGPYQLIAESLETFCARLAMVQDDRDEALNYAYTEAGQRYLTSRP